MTSPNLFTSTTLLLILSSLLLTSASPTAPPIPRSHLSHIRKNAQPRDLPHLGIGPLTSVTLNHNEAYHSSRRRDLAGWLLREKEKVDNKYGIWNEGEGDKEKRAESEVQLANQDKDASYSAKVSFGSSGQSFDLALDTGSADLWVLSTECALPACSALARFDPTTSTSYKNGTTSFGISYGSGTASGHLGADTVTMGSFSVQGQTFGVVSSISSGLLDSPLSGLMGLGFKSLAVTGATPWWQSLATSSSWTQPLFGFYLKRYRNVDSASATETDGGLVTLGYTDSSLYSGDITWVSVDSDKQAYWNIPIAGMTVQGTTINLNAGVNAAIDTGTTLIGGPADTVAAIYAAIPGSRKMTGSLAGYYEYPCSSTISLTMTFGSFRVTITEADFNIGRYSSDQSYCTGGIYIQGLSSASPVQWVVGDTMLKNVYTVYRYSPAAVGFAYLPGVVVASSNSASAATVSGTGVSASATAVSGNSTVGSMRSTSTSVVVITATATPGNLSDAGTLQTTLLGTIDGGASTGSGASSASASSASSATTSAASAAQSTSGAEKLLVHPAAILLVTASMVGLWAY